MSRRCRYLRQYISLTHTMTNPDDSRTRLSIARLTLLFLIFFLIACGLGYPILNRFDPRQTPGLSDVNTYASLVTGATSTNAADTGYRRFRVLVPLLARPFYLFARGRVASWDPVMFALLVADSLFLAATAVLIVMIGARQSGNSAVGLVGALLYMVNFAVPNLRLVGLVDAGEGFFLLALLWTLSESQLWALPLIAILGVLTKESFVPFIIVFTLGWWLSERKGKDRASSRDNVPRNQHKSIHSFAIVGWILASWALSVATIVVLHIAITGIYASPLQISHELHRGGGSHFDLSLHDRNLWYIFLWLLPTAIPNLKHFPRSWLIPIGATCAAALLLDAYFGGGTGSAWGRVFFSIAGPVLSLSSAMFLLRICTSIDGNHLIVT